MGAYWKKYGQVSVKKMLYLGKTIAYTTADGTITWLDFDSSYGTNNTSNITFVKDCKVRVMVINGNIYNANNNTITVSLNNNVVYNKQAQNNANNVEWGYVDLDVKSGDVLSVYEDINQTGYNACAVSVYEIVGMSISKIPNTDWMPFRIIPYNSYHKGFVVCTKGYSKIGIKCTDSNSARQMDVYTANDRSSVDLASGETLLGSAVGVNEVQIDLQANDYVWLWTHDTGSGNKTGWYRLLT